MDGLDGLPLHPTVGRRFVQRSWYFIGSKRGRLSDGSTQRMVFNSIHFFRLDPIICGSALAGPAGPPGSTRVHQISGARTRVRFAVESTMMGDGDGDVAGCQALLAMGSITTTTTGYIPSAL